MKEKIRKLPNPDVPRKAIEKICVADICAGCNRLFEVDNETNVCESYIDPMIWARLGTCPMNEKKQTIAKKKINPIKFSKRFH